MIQKALYIAKPAPGISITTIAKTMDEDIFQSIIHCHITEVVKVFIKGMHTPIGQQAKKMNLPVIVAGIRKGFCQYLVIFYIPCLTFFVNLYQILVNNSSCSDIQMSHF